MKDTIKPYLLRAFYDWAFDQKLTPHILVYVNQDTLVPNQYVKDNEIVLNIRPDACQDFVLGNDFIHFTARFSGKPFDICIPIGHVLHIFARENGEGMSFELQEYHAKDDENQQSNSQSIPQAPTSGLKIVKRKKSES